MRNKKPSPGIGVDSSGNQAFDPTSNVYKLVDAAVTRLDDLRMLQIYYEKEIRNMEAKYVEAKDAQQALQNKTFEARMAEVERVQYEGKGKSEVTEPIMDKFLQKLDGLIEARSTKTGESLGRKELLGWIITGIVLAATITTVIIKLI